MSHIYKILPLLFVWSFAQATNIFETKYAIDVCKDGSTSMEAVNCAYKKYEMVEALLNTKYKELHSKMDTLIEDAYSEKSRKQYADIKQLHIVSQRSWIKFRENECNAVKEWYRGGKLQDGLYYDCMRSMAERRIDEFDSFTDYP